MSKSLLPLEVHDLTVSYNRKPVLYGIDLEIDEGGLIGIIGPNGAGKSTLIKTIMGIVPANGGWVKICLLYTSPSPRDGLLSRMPSSA